MILKTYKEPTDIVLCGCYVEDDVIEHAFGITDDYSCVEVKGYNKSIYLQTTGFCYIFTRVEFEEHRHLINDEDSDELLFIDDFQGDIEIELILHDGKWNNIDVLDPECDPRNYLLYEMKQPYRKEMNDLDRELVLKIPTNIMGSSIVYDDYIRMKRISKLKHYADTTEGLWATDRPDLVDDPQKVLFQLKV